MSGLKAAHTHLIARKAGKPGVRERSGNRAVAGAGYTIAHAGRQIRLGPVAFWIFVGTVVIMAGWSWRPRPTSPFGTILLKGLIARQAEQQYAYEDRDRRIARPALIAPPAANCSTRNNSNKSSTI